jgi:hypothetical protein
MSSESKEDIKLEEFNDVVDSLQYSGYDPAYTRTECLRRFTVRELIEIVTVYMMVGNNINKMSVKREDEDKARALMIRLQSRGIQGVKPKDRSKDTLTLSRIAMSFAPLLYILRANYSNKLQDRNFSRLPVLQQDICLTPLMRFSILDRSYTDFLRFFSDQINGDVRSLDLFTNLSASNGQADDFIRDCASFLESHNINILNGDKKTIEFCFRAIVNRIRELQDSIKK